MRREATSSVLLRNGRKVRVLKTHRIRGRAVGGRQIVAAVVATLAGVTASLTTEANPASGESSPVAESHFGIPRRTAEDVREGAIKFRQKFGLPYDDGSLAAADANPAREAQSRYGVALTPAEFTEQVNRDAWADAKGPMSEAVKQRPDEFAGMWIDQEHGGGFVVMALPSATAVSKAAVLAAAPVGAPVSFAPAQHSYTALEGAYKLLSGHQVDVTASTPNPANPLVDLRARGFTVLSTGLDTKSNRVSVGVKGLTRERVGELEAAWDRHAASGALPARHAIRIAGIGGSAAQESRHQSPVTMKAGLTIIGTNGDRRGRCTSNMSATGGVVLTAAHCFGPNVRVSHADHEVAADLVYDGFFNGSTADVEAIRLRTPRMASRHMFAAFGCNGNLETCQQVDQANAVHSGTYDGGERVCMGGSSTYWISCGVVRIPIFTITYADGWRGPVTFADQVAADYANSPGDSGAVVGVGRTVHGIHSGHVEDDVGCVTCIDPASTRTMQQTEAEVGWSVFSRMARAQANMNRNIVTARTWVGITSAFAGGKCADVYNNLSTNGTRVWSWPCDGNLAQQWSIEPYGTMTVEPNLWWTIKRFNPSSKCMDIDINAGNGAQVQQWDCNGHSQQIFRFDKYGYEWNSDKTSFRILSMRTGSCVDLDTSGGGQQNGANIQQWQCLGDGQRNQYWRSF